MYNFKDIVPGTVITSVLTIVMNNGESVNSDKNKATITEVFSEFHGVFIDEAGYENAVKVSPVTDAEFELAQTVIEPADYTNVQYVNDERKPWFSAGQIYFKQFGEVTGIIEAFITDEVSNQKYYVTATRRKV